MLGKLIKYEFNATKTVCFACNIGMLVLALLGGLLFLIDPAANNETGGHKVFTSAVTAASVQVDTSSTGLILAKIGYVLLCVISIAVVCIVLKYYFFYRYYKNYFTDEGYLMHTLPVTSGQLIVSKLIVATLWQYVTAILTVVCIVALVCGALANMNMWSSVYDSFAEGYKSLIASDEFSQMIPAIICYLIILVVTPIAYNLYMYLAVSIGQKAKSNKLMASIGMLVALYVVRKFVFTLINFGVPSANFALFGNMIPNSDSQESMIAYVVGYTIFMIVVSVALFFWNKHLMEKQLNLE